LGSAQLFRYNPLVLLKSIYVWPRLLRPRTWQGTLARVDRFDATARELRAELSALRTRTDQLEAVARLDWEMQEEIRGLDTQLDLRSIGAHVMSAIARAPLATEPFPHVVVEDWLPGDVYRTMLRALPPPVFFADREEGRQRMRVPFTLAPIYSRRVWDVVAEEIVGRFVRDALAAKFDGAIKDFLASFYDGGDAADVPLHPSDGRIMLRRPGYVIAPHRDPRWGFITGLVYLARPGDNEAHGTQLYRVTDDREAPNDKPLYVHESQCELVRTVPYKANTLLAFLNSVGAHGASIPADAQPATLERYVYQFRLGPDSKSIKALLSRMSAGRRDHWAGGKAKKGG